MISDYFEKLLKMHRINDNFNLNDFAVELIREESGLELFSFLNFSTSDLTYHVLFTTVDNEYIKDMTFFDVEIEAELPSELFIEEESFNVFQRLFFESDNIKYVFLIHENKDFNQEKLAEIINSYIVANKNRNLIKYYQNSLLTSQYQLDILNGIGELIGSFDLDVVLAKLLENAINIVNGDVGGIFLFDKETNRLVPKTNWGVKGEKLLSIMFTENNISAIEETYNNREIKFIPEINEHSGITFPEDIFVHSLVTIPLFTKNENLGVLILINFQLDETFVDGKLVTLESLAKIASIGIENSIYFQQSIEQEKFNTQLNIAANIQKNLLPSEDLLYKNIQVSGLSMAAMNVGGDFYSYLQTGNKVYAFLGDVSGKGIPAALLTTMAMIVIKTSLNPDISLEKIMYKINNTISEESLGENYLTLGLFEVDTENDQAVVVGCSQEVLHYIHSENRLVKFDSKNLPVGMFDNVDYFVETVDFCKGDMFFTFSDGITDAVNRKGEDYGLERLEKMIFENTDLNASKIKKAIVNDVIKFSEGADQFDDLTLLVIKRL